MILHDCKNELKDVDLKITPARLGVLAALERTTTPLDINEIITFLIHQDIHVDKVTVFRIMHSLTKKGLAIPIQFNEGKLRYEHSEKADHHHFICELCGIVEDISDCNIDAFQDTIKEKKGLLIKRHSLEFFGLCKQCQR